MKKVFLPIIFFIIIIFFLNLFQNNNILKKDYIGVIKIQGAIFDSEDIIKQIQYFYNNKKIKALILQINSPGGSVAPVQEIYHEILKFKKLKPVYSSISSIAASGGYYIALATNKIYANSGSLIGNIGVIMYSMNIENLLNKLGIKPNVIKAGKNKDLGSIFRKSTSEEKQILDSLLKDTHSIFIQAVQDNRNINKESYIKEKYIFKKN